MYNWNPNSKPSDVKLHKETLKAGIKYYKSRNATKANELKAELKSLNEFFNQ